MHTFPFSCVFDFIQCHWTNASANIQLVHNIWDKHLQLFMHTSVKREIHSLEHWFWWEKSVCRMFGILKHHIEFIEHTQTMKKGYRDDTTMLTTCNKHCIIKCLNALWHSIKSNGMSKFILFNLQLIANCFPYSRHCNNESTCDVVRALTRPSLYSVAVWVSLSDYERACRFWHWER